MPLLATGHKRTGACPTFERPVLQRDGFLLRVPLVGGALDPSQAAAVAQVAAVDGNGTIELTNRGNLQVRGIREEAVDAATARLRAVGLGDAGAALVTISPFADPSDHDLRRQVLDALDDLLHDGGALSPKFVIHVDDAAGTTAARRSEATVARHGDRVRVVIDALGVAEVRPSEAIDLVRALAAACRTIDPEARVADVVDATGVAWLHAVLPVELDGPSRRRPSPTVEPGPGPYVAPDGQELLLAAPVFGRTDAATIARLAELGVPLRITPWRTIALAAAFEAVAEALGLIVDAADPAAGVVACIGAAGCWQTEADTGVEAERVVADRRRTGGASLGGVHVSGCDKRCATRAPVALTLVGRVDGSGFDRVLR